ncbi:MAG: PDZ domain-containing protein [Myxococcota bacterium]
MKTPPTPPLLLSGMSGAVLLAAWLAPNAMAPTDDALPAPEPPVASVWGWELCELPAFPEGVATRGTLTIRRDVQHVITLRDVPLIGRSIFIPHAAHQDILGDDDPWIEFRTDDDRVIVELSWQAGQRCEIKEAAVAAHLTAAFSPHLAGLPVSVSGCGLDLDVTEPGFDHWIDARRLPCEITMTRQDGYLKAPSVPLVLNTDAAGESIRAHIALPETARGGLGIWLYAMNRTIMAKEILPGTPAAKAGLQPGDVITALNGVSTEMMSVDDYVQRSTGRIGVPVTLTIARGSRTFDVTMTREFLPRN